jgi:hypothetical protein
MQAYVTVCCRCDTGLGLEFRRVPQRCDTGLGLEFRRVPQRTGGHQGAQHRLRRPSRCGSLRIVCCCWLHGTMGVVCKSAGQVLMINIDYDDPAGAAGAIMRL